MIPEEHYTFLRDWNLIVLKSNDSEKGGVGDCVNPSAMRSLGSADDYIITC